MSEAFLIRVTDDKRGVTSPDIVGPFTSYEEADAFREKYGMREVIDGGYAECHIVSRETCDMTSSEYAVRALLGLADEDE